MTLPKLKRLRALRAAGTRDWKSDVGYYPDPDGYDDVWFARGPFNINEPTPKKQALVDAALICAAVNALVPHCDEIERLTAENEALREENEMLRDGCNGPVTEQLRAERDEALAEAKRQTDRAEAMEAYSGFTFDQLAEKLSMIGKGVLEGMAAERDRALARAAKLREALLSLIEGAKNYAPASAAKARAALAADEKEGG